MNRRDFLKSALVITALAPLSRLGILTAETASTPAGGVPQITRRRFRDTDITLPLLGFGCMRLPQFSPIRPEIDYSITEKMFDQAMVAGCNYFDTAYPYHEGLSEKCVGDLLSKYPRESYLLADKMPVRNVERAGDLEQIFNEQLAKCKTEYFDFYLAHNLNRDRMSIMKKFKVYEFLSKKKAEGKIRQLGFSFHDEPSVLEVIAQAYPWDFVQIQLNYLDWTLYQSQQQYEIVTKLGLPVIVMEPLRGGALATLNEKATKILKQADPEASTASWALRYAASFPNVICVLSGMSLPEHVEDNLKTFTNFKPLTEAERGVLAEALVAYRSSGAIACTSCRYCMPCPAGVNIPHNFELYNCGEAYDRQKPRMQEAYSKLKEDEKASSCVECGVCLKKCPQKLDIPTLLRMVAKELDPK